MMHPGSSLESWTARIQGQLRDVLEPTERFSEISPTEALGISLNANTKWTLIALANLARDDDSSAVSTLVWHAARRLPWISGTMKFGLDYAGQTRLHNQTLLTLNLPSTYTTHSTMPGFAGPYTRLGHTPRIRSP